MISHLRLIVNSLRHYWQLNVVLLSLTALTSALITGALILGDSVTHSLHQMSQNRLGQTQWVIQANAHPFRISLANRLAKTLQTNCAPVINLDVIASKPGGSMRLPNCHLLGVDTRFSSLLTDHAAITPAAGEVFLNKKTADYLKCQLNDTLLFFVPQTTSLPADAPFSQKTDMVTLRLKVSKILTADQFGNFSLQINPAIPFNAFVNLEQLAKAAAIPGQCNHLLIANNPNLDQADITTSLDKVWGLPDTALEIKDLTGTKRSELRSHDVFMPSRVIAGLADQIPHAEPLFTYFVNSLESNNRSTPYSMVSSLPMASNLNPADDEIVINSWLSQDLQAKPGDRITLRFYVIDSTRRLKTKTAAFRVKTIIPLQGWAADKTLMPDFPGLSDAGNCRDWEPGVPIDLERIRPKDEDYWDNYRGTPKAFISLSKAQSLWGNAFGNLTAWRFPSQYKPVVLEQLNQTLVPGSFGVQMMDIQSASEKSANDSIDFSELFLGLSFFMMISSLWLLSLCFGFSITRRNKEIGLLRSLGFPSQRIRHLFLTEGTLIALAGSLLGLAIAIAYNQLLLWGLKTLWFDAIRTTELTTFVTLRALIIGFSSALIASLIAMVLALRSQFKSAIITTVRRPLSSWWFWINAFMFAALLITIAVALFARLQVSAGFFVLAGILGLANGLIFFIQVFQKLLHRASARPLALRNLAFQNIGFRRNNSLAVTALLAIGLFMIVAVSANRQSMTKNADNPASGTGSYSLFCQTTRSLNFDLNQIKNQMDLGLDTDILKDTTFVSLRMNQGNDASCLNINRTLTPGVLGVDPSDFIKRKAFTFTGTAENHVPNNPWALLDQPLADDSIPVIADQTVIQWGLGLTLGDKITMTDDHGQTVHLKLVAGLANSIFQGYLLMGEQDFLKHFSSRSGFQVVLAHSPGDRIQSVQAELLRGLQPYGIVITPAPQRLAEFNSLQNTYLSIFLLLGGLGMMLSTVGLAVILIRNLLERRGETALLWALGFSRQRTNQMMLMEYGSLLLFGIIIGTISALVSVLPSLVTPGTQMPYALLAVVIAGIAMIGLGVLHLAGRFALPQHPAEGLRTE